MGRKKELTKGKKRGVDRDQKKHASTTEKSNTRKIVDMKGMHLDDLLNIDVTEGVPGRNPVEVVPKEQRVRKESDLTVVRDEKKLATKVTDVKKKRNRVSTKSAMEISHDAASAPTANKDENPSADDTSDEGASSSDEELELHKSDLENLKKTDPEFYEYLKDTDKDLLDFESDEEDEGQEDSHAKKNIGEEKPQESSPPYEKGVVTSESLDSWCDTALEKGSLPALKYLLRVYRVACHYGDGDESDESMHLASSAVYNKIMLFMLKNTDIILRKSLEIEDQGVDEVDVIKQPRWGKVEPLVRSYLGNTLHLLGNMTDSGMLAYIFGRLRDSIVFLGPFDKLRRKFLARALKVFASNEDEPRVQAILFMRAMATKLPSLDQVLRGLYKTYSAHSKFMSPSSAPGLRFMASCIVEMYGIDLTATYEHAFGAIKELAILMRQALTSKSKEAYKEVYCWETMNRLELWQAVVMTYPSELEPLFYPLSQLLLGACGLIPSPSFIPLRLKCIRMLNRMATANTLYIPVASTLMDVLQWKELNKKSKTSPANVQTDINSKLRAGSSMLRASQFQEEVVDVVFELLTEHLALWGYHPAFLEVSFLPFLRLKAFMKKTSVDRYRRGAKQVCEAIVATQDSITRARNPAQISPKDTAKIAEFSSNLKSKGELPIHTLATSLKQQARQRQDMRSMYDATIGIDQSDEDADVRSKGQKRSATNDYREPSRKRQVVEPDQLLDDDIREDHSHDYLTEDKIDVYELSDDDE